MQFMTQYAAKPVGNGQPEAQAFFGAGLMAVQAFELLENHLTFVFRNTWATVPDFEAQMRASTPYAQQYRALAVAERVGQEVLQNPSQ